MKIECRAFDGPSDWGWINQRVDILRSEDTSGITFVDAETNKTVAMCIMDNWTRNSVQIHAATLGAHVMRNHHQEILAEIFDYIFNVRERKSIFAWVVGSNEKSLALAARIGFTERVRLPEGFSDGVDYVLIGIDRDDSEHLYIPRHINYPLELGEGGS